MDELVKRLRKDYWSWNGSWNVMFDHQISRCFFTRNFANRSVLMSRNFETLGCQRYGVKRMKFILAHKGNGGKSYGAPLYYLK